MRIALLISFVLVASSAVAEEYVALFGRGVSQQYVPGVEQRCPEDMICMDVVYRWTIRVEKLVSGNLSGKTVKAAMIQHTKYVNAHKHQALFVLSPITDEEKRKLVGADFWIEEYQPPQELYCLTQAGEKYGLESAEEVGFYAGTNCVFRANDN